MKRKRKKKKKTEYIAFCEVCGIPNCITRDKLRGYLAAGLTDKYYCYNCLHPNVFPDYIIEIAEELADQE